MIRKFFAALGCAVLGAAVMLLALPLLLGQRAQAVYTGAAEAASAAREGRDARRDGGGDRARGACGRAVR